jgi:hypothetical protein
MMRARLISTVFAVAGLLAMTGATSVATSELAGGHEDHDGADRCVAKGEAGVGPVCVVVNDVLSDILTA